MHQRWLASGRLAPAHCHLDLSDGAPHARVDPDHLRLAIDELVDNAIDATSPHQRRITVKTRPLPTDDRVVIAVADNGRGMTPDVREKALDPFFSHRPAGRGRGLGLCRVDRWVRLNGGSVQLFSAPFRP